MEQEDIVRSSSGLTGEQGGKVTSFLSDTVLCWSINDIDNDSIGKSKVIYHPSLSIIIITEFQYIHRIT
jgi:hypothetical protein